MPVRIPRRSRQFAALMLVVASSAVGAQPVRTPAPPPAQRWQATGVILGVSAEGNAGSRMPGSVAGSTRGVGGRGLMLGYGITPNYSVLANLGWGQFQTRGAGAGVRAIDLHIRRNLKLASGRVSPFVQAGATNQDRVVLPAVGAGVNAYLTRGVAITGAASVGVGRFGTTPEPRAVRATAPRFQLGLVFYPAAVVTKKASSSAGR